MSVSSKGKRRIIVEGQTYFWNVALDDESDYYLLNIVSDDKTLVLSCPLKARIPYLISKGRVFQTREMQGKWGWKRFALPFDVPDTVTPKFVEQLVVWSAHDRNAIQIHDAIEVPV